MNASEYDPDVAQVCGSRKSYSYFKSTVFMRCCNRTLPPISIAQYVSWHSRAIDGFRWRL